MPPTSAFCAPLWCARYSAYLLLAAVLLTPHAFAQAAPAAGPAIPPAAAPKPPDVSREAMAWDKLVTRIRFEEDGTGTRETTAAIRVLADAGVKQLAVLAFTYTASNQKIDIDYVRVRKPDGTVVVTPDYNAQDMPADVSREAPMYSDIHQKHVAVKALGVGDTLEYHVFQRTLTPEIPGHFWTEYNFEKEVIILDEELDIDVPADKTVNVKSAELQPTEKSENGRKLYHWASSNNARPDPDAPPKSIKHWKPSVQLTTFSSWDQIGAWYASLQKSSLVITPAIQARADTLTKGLASDDDKIRAIFSDVALHIHYIGLEFGIGRYQPHPADDVLSNEYGDCKDKHTLLATLLKAAGIEAWPVLISSSHEIDEALPSPGQFDHVITVVPRQGKLLWMDSTAEIAPVGVLFGGLRDKQALAVPPDKPAHLEQTPAALPYTQQNVYKVDGKLSPEGEFTAHFDESYHGDAEMVMRAVLRTVSQSQYTEVLQTFARATGFAGEVKQPEISAIEQTTQPLHIAYDYTRDKFSDWDNRRLSPPLPPTGWESAPGVKEKKPADDVNLGSPGEDNYTASVQMPAGWSLYPPPATDLKEDWAEYHSTYSFKNGTFKAERRLLVKQSKVPLAQWDKYLEFRRAILVDESRVAPFFNGEGIEGGPGSLSVRGLPTDEVTKILEPLRDANTILSGEKPGADDLAKARDLARKAVDGVEEKTLQLKPDDFASLYWSQILSLAWETLGQASLASNDLPAAESYLRSAWHLDQERHTGYQLGRLLEAKGDKTAAAHQYFLCRSATVLNPLHIDSSAVDEQLGKDYRRLTGRDIEAPQLRLPGGRYEGSPRAELDKQTEFRQIVKTSKLTGAGLFALVFEAGKPTDVKFLGGDTTIRTFEPVLKTFAFHPEFPTGSKARILREMRLVCTPYAGCDGYMMLPSAVVYPEIHIKPGNVRSIPIQVAPPQ